MPFHNMLVDAGELGVFNVKKKKVLEKFVRMIHKLQNIHRFSTTHFT